MKKKLQVFLGGTCDGYDWRKEFIPKILMPYFNPVVENWTEECRLREEKEKKESEYLLFVITKDIKGVYSIAEVVDYAHRAIKEKKKIIFCNIYSKDGCKTKEQQQMQKSLDAVGELLKEINSDVVVCNKLEDAALYLNQSYRNLYVLA